MKTIEFDRYGPPHEVCYCIEVAEPSAPGPDEDVVEVEALSLIHISETTRQEAI